MIKCLECSPIFIFSFLKVASRYYVIILFPKILWFVLSERLFTDFYIFLFFQKWIITALCLVLKFVLNNFIYLKYKRILLLNHFHRFPYKYVFFWSSSVPSVSSSHRSLFPYYQTPSLLLPFFVVILPFPSIYPPYQNPSYFLPSAHSNTPYPAFLS